MQLDTSAELDDTWRCECGAEGLIPRGRIPFVTATRTGSVRHFVVILDGAVIHRCREDTEVQR